MVAFVATALCADRVATAAPMLRPEVVSIARRLASRLVVSFRGTIPAVRIHETRDHKPSLVALAAPAAEQSDVVQRVTISPFQFRLPPPSA